MKSFFNWGVKKEVERLREENCLLGIQLDRENTLREDLRHELEETKYKTNELKKSLKTILNELTEANTKLKEYKLANDLLEKELIKKNKVLEKDKVEKKELKAKIKGLEKELDKRYIVKRLKPTKPSKQVIGIKYANKQSKIIKELKEDKE